MNILSKVEYALTFGELGIATNTISYEYKSNSDAVTKYGNDTMSYDIDGRPIRYRGYLMEWIKGGQLSELSGNGITMSFKYNNNGIRTKKTVNGVDTEYFYVGDTLVSQKTGEEVINFAYTAGGTPYGFTYNGTSYFYLTNIQGDIIGIYDSNGNVVVKYTYDTWGKLISITGSLASTIGVKNPLRYRGYYYDTETSLYYLQARYYDPDICRFISPDALLVAGNDYIQGMNRYAYCYNNPVMYSDPTGYETEVSLLGLMNMAIAIINFLTPIVDYMSPYITMVSYLDMSVAEAFLFTLDVGDYDNLVYIVNVMYNGKVASESEENSVERTRALAFIANEALADKSVCMTVAKYFTWIEGGTDQLSVAKEIYAHAMMYNKYDLIKFFADPFVKMLDDGDRTIDQITETINLGGNSQLYLDFYDLIWSVTNEV